MDPTNIFSTIAIIGMIGVIVAAITAIVCSCINIQAEEKTKHLKLRLEIKKLK